MNNNNNNARDGDIERMEKELESHAFAYCGNGEWQDAVTSLRHPTSIAYKILKQRMKEVTLWTHDDMGDFIVTIDRTDEGIPAVQGRIIKCCLTSKRGYRWMLLVNNHFSGFWDSCNKAKEKFDKDCVSHGNCPDCGQPNGSSNCCQNDEELWK